MNRFLPCYLMWLLLFLSLPAHASLFDEVGRSLLSGPAQQGVSDTSRDMAISRLVPDTLLDQNPLDARTSLDPGNGRKPEFFLMPVGRSDEFGVGIGVRFPF